MNSLLEISFRNINKNIKEAHCIFKVLIFIALKSEKKRMSHLLRFCNI